MGCLQSAIRDCSVACLSSFVVFSTEKKYARMASSFSNKNFLNDLTSSVMIDILHKISLISTALQARS